MARGREQVDAVGLHVDRQVAGRLGRVHDQRHARLARDPPDRPQRLHGAGDVAGVRERDELRVRFNERVAGSDDTRRDVVCIIKLRVKFVRVNFDAREARIGVE